MHLPKSVIIKEVGPRDGLQNEKAFIPTENKIEWINKLSETGLSHIEITSFVPPKWIPQLADSFEVAQGIERAEGISYSALVPNVKGLDRALDAGVDEVAVFMSASEGHNKNNINKTIDETFPLLNDVVKKGLTANKRVRGYVSTVFGCPYDGEVSIKDVIRVVDSLLEMGVYEISLGDTIGVANPLQVEEVLTELFKRFDKSHFAMHFHNTRGLALANVVASLQMGVTVFDSALGGLGGCPYAKGASGNLATDDLVYMLHSMGIQTNIDEQKLYEAAKYVESKIGRNLTSHQMLANN
ncbi:hydroxymethylglutaryl-CoA lyase [Lottiidibacillus patelloidae]|uniref:Hydroxymethylglutaryl-CoA lyase n=1 Tax=Lottiidibacillus patelloidae TaxID=2670334 RepID=A0A263BU12_9BACI|nr:hydroxymethylglutaryl-CoA lyase [Lottiidibacillus patelloidae]OZM57233.1 hydroxymethylglutaryl-CoA lyase [Lottiidibacillus patelloidae]